MSREGGCFCGAVRILSTGEVQGKALCHCRDCKKIGGSTYSTNIIVPGDGLSVTNGAPKEITVKADSGNDITSYFCGDCGSTLWRKSATFGDSRVVKVGVLDDVNALNDAAPAIELYTKDRPNWVSPVPGAAQKVGMPNSADA